MYENKKEGLQIFLEFSFNSILNISYRSGYKAPDPKFYQNRILIPGITGKGEILTVLWVEKYNFLKNGVGQKYPILANTPLHKGVRYPCDLCSHSSTNKGDLLKHKKAKHFGIRYPCDQCDYTCTQSGLLNLHKKKKHQGADAQSTEQ